MEKDLTLLILAAGMGSRFGGLKQIEPMGPNGEFIIDYSIADAIEAGFTKVIFLIKEENYSVFKETIGARVEKFIKTEYCFQKNDNMPDDIMIPNDRQKPLGTGHAILCCKEKINEPFMVINADDFYGKDSYIKGANFLKKMKNNSDTNYALIGYQVTKTMTENGAVKRGVCKIKNDYLTELIESNIEKIDENIVASPLGNLPDFVLKEKDVVSMNMLLFNPSVFDYIEKEFKKFLNVEKQDLEKCEFLITDVLFNGIKENFCSVNVIPTTSTWYGVTYQKDLDDVKKALKKLTDDNVYQNNLWK